MLRPVSRQSWHRIDPSLHSTAAIGSPQAAHCCSNSVPVGDATDAASLLLIRADLPERTVARARGRSN